MDNIPDRPAPPDEVVVATWVWLAGLVVIACAAGPTWAVAALATTAACFPLYVARSTKRKDRLHRAIGEQIEQLRTDTGLHPSTRELRIACLEMALADLTSARPDTPFPTELTRSRIILRNAAHGVLTATSTTIVILVYAVALLGPFALVGGVLYLWIGVWALPAAVAVAPLGPVMVRRLPPHHALHKAVKENAVRVTPLG